MKKTILLLGLTALLSIYSCSKDEVKSKEVDSNLVEIDANKMITHNVYYKGEKFVLTGEQDFDKKIVNWENIPDQIKEWNKSGKENVVSHVLLYDDHTDVYLFDNEEEHQVLFKYEDGNQNRLKGANEVSLKTYNDIYTNSTGGTVYANVLRSISNCCWAKRCFGNFWCYGDGTGWVGNIENDNISGIQLGQTWWSGERAQFVCCQDANWGGAKLYITRISTGTAPAYANMFNYNYTYIWNRNWNDEISSYELFQTNLFLSGQQI